jgi:WhiB family transcriptional regulator, redox-sensing transcriptional regulator
MSTVLERSRTREMSGPMGQNWRAIGLCRGSDTLTFYPPSEDDSLAEEAKTICSGCAVRRPCLEFALTTREKHGVWGGLTERERRRVLRQRRRSA